jgi:hypothetical protein
MPGGDRTGPRGMGPLTGRAVGYCAGYDAPGYWNSGRGRGAGFGAGRGARGGMAWRSGWGRGGRGWPRQVPTENPAPTELTSTDQEKLEQRLDRLQAEVSELRRLFPESPSSPEGGQ